jgi:hypothetical protein
MQKELQVENLEPRHMHEVPSLDRARTYVQMLRVMRPERRGSLPDDI